MALSAAIGVHTYTWMYIRVCIGACVLGCPFVNYRLIQSRLVELDIILMIYAFEWQHHKMPQSIPITHTHTHKL